MKKKVQSKKRTSEREEEKEKKEGRRKIGGLLWWLWAAVPLLCLCEQGWGGGVCMRACSTGGRPGAVSLCGCAPDDAVLCGVENSSRSAPVLRGWRSSTLPHAGEMMTIWWSALRSMLPLFRRVSKSARRSSELWAVTTVSAIRDLSPFLISTGSISFQS